MATFCDIAYMTYIGIANCTALYCQSRTHVVCWPNENDPTGEMAFDCPQTDSEAIVDAGQIDFAKANECPPGAAILRTLNP
jgi:hypothetical protein